MGLSPEFRSHKHYSEETKKEAVYRILSGELRRGEAIKEYGIKSWSSLGDWLEKYGHGILSEHKELFEQMGRRKAKKAVKGEKPGREDLQREVAKLRKALESAELRAEAYSMMIDIAERELKVAIRKKSGTK
jgi:transposase